MREREKERERELRRAEQVDWRVVLCVWMELEAKEGVANQQDSWGRGQGQGNQ